MIAASSSTGKRKKRRRKKPKSSVDKCSFLKDPFNSLLDHFDMDSHGFDSKTKSKKTNVKGS